MVVPQNFEIVDHTRQFILEGPLRVLGVARYGFLFNDCLLICKIPQKQGQLYATKQLVSLKEAFAVDEEPGT